jgi:DNA-binding CsgD family transcriptional regulator
MKTNVGARHRYADLSILTPSEERLWELSQRGLKSKQIAEALGKTTSGKVISERLRLIRRKLELKELMNDQDRRLSWN